MLLHSLPWECVSPVKSKQEQEQRATGCLDLILESSDKNSHQDGASSEVYSLNSAGIELDWLCISVVETTQPIFDPIDLHAADMDINLSPFLPTPPGTCLIPRFSYSLVIQASILCHSIRGCGSVSAIISSMLQTTKISVCWRERERAHCIFLHPIVQQCEHLHAQRQSPLAELPHGFNATACAHVSGQGKALRRHLHTAQGMSNGRQKDRVLTMFWMTSFRPGQSPPQVTTAAVTCQSPTTACQQCASMHADTCR